MCQRGTSTHVRPSFYRKCCRLGHCRRRRRRPPPSLLPPSVAAVSAAATIAVSAVVCPRCCHCFCLTPPFLPAPAVATAAVCRRHCPCRHHRHRRPCSFRHHRCHRCLFFCRHHHCLYVSTFPTASIFQRFCRHSHRCLYFDRHRHDSSSLQVVRR
jgi:hypothetical protein